MQRAAVISAAISAMEEGRDKDREVRRRSRDRDRSRDRYRYRERPGERRRDDRGRSDREDRGRSDREDRGRSEREDRGRSDREERGRSDREDRGRSDRDDNRDDRGRSDRYREDRHRDRHRDRYDRERDYKSSRKEHSRSKSRERRRRTKSRERRDESSRSRERSVHSKDRDRSKRNLSVEIEQELLHLRKLSDMKAAKDKSQNPTNRLTESEIKREPESSNSGSGTPEPVDVKPKVDFAKTFIGAGQSNSGVKAEYVPEIETEEERIEFQKKMQEKLQAHLAAEGKLYPRPKPSPAINSVTGFANDGSFLEMFKKMQEQAQPAFPSAVADESVSQHYVASSSQTQTYQQPAPVPMIGRRRGGKILKTGMVKKAKPIEDSYSESPNDAWNLYLLEVKKYKNASCDADSKTRPLVK